MFMGITLVDLDENFKIKSELRTVVNTDAIEALVENKKVPNTCVMTFKPEVSMSNGLIKGSYDDISKVLFGFNRPYRDRSVTP